LFFTPIYQPAFVNLFLGITRIVAKQMMVRITGLSVENPQKKGINNYVIICHVVYYGGFGNDE